MIQILVVIWITLIRVRVRTELGYRLGGCVSPQDRVINMTPVVRKWLCGRVPDLQSGGCGFESQPGLLCTKVYSSFYPSGR